MWLPGRNMHLTGGRPMQAALHRKCTGTIPCPQKVAEVLGDRLIQVTAKAGSTVLLLLQGSAGAS